MNKPVISGIVTIIILLGISGVIMFFAQGYQFDIRNRNLEQTGILTINSVPEGALVYLNDVPQDVTNNSIQGLKPGSYQLRLEKTGYQPWSKKADITVGNVTQHTALLISLFPEIKPLTLTGLSNPKQSPDGQKIAYTTSQSANDLPSQSGVWLLEFSNNPFNILSGPRLLLTDTPTRMYSQAEITWGADEQSLVIRMPDQLLFIYNTESHDLREVTRENLEILQEDWAELATKKEELLRAQLPQDIQNILPTTASGAVWSPDQTKLLYTEIIDNTRTYKILDLNPTEFSLPAQSVEDVAYHTVFTEAPDKNTPVLWHPDSRHIVTVEKISETEGVVSIIELDGDNKSVIYTGKIMQHNVFVHPDGNKVLIHTNFSSEQGQNNLYAISFN